MAERAEIRVLYVNGDFAELNRRLGQELAHDAEAFTTTLANLPKLLKMAEKKQLMGPSLGMEAQARLGAVDEDVDTHPHLPDTMQSEEGKAVRPSGNRAKCHQTPIQADQGASSAL